MKILAIRGRNLASLATEFCVDFQSEPLASAGLFAITGPTGAGKSTLLDALCVALYEATPRLLRAASRSGIIPDVGEHSVGPADPRTLLRRGAGEGFAEVDFVGSDGVAYRARWSVRRARSKAEGKLQSTEVSLTRIDDGQVLSGNGKTETLKLIEARIGLSFEQFTRAVLLAQNDFAAFLRASDDERAELLQTLTGTAAYAEISRQAYLRAKAEGEALRLLQAQLADQVPLDVDARQAREAALAGQTARLDALSQQQAAVEAQLRWHQERARLAGRVADSQQQLEAARQARGTAEARRAALGRIEAVQPARPLCASLDRLSAEHLDAGKAVANAEAALAAALRAAADCAARHQAATQAQASAEQARSAAQPQLNKARALDASLGTLTPQHHAARQARDAATQAHNQTQARQQRVAADHAAVRQAQQNAAGWLADHASLRPLAEGWARWETLLAQAAGQWRSQQTLTGEKDEAARSETRLKDELARAGQHLSTAVEAAAKAADTHKSLAEQCAALDPDTLAGQRKALQIRRNHLSRAAQLAADQARLRASLQTQQQEDSAARKALAGYESTLADGQARLPLLARDADAAERALAIARLAASENVEALRQQLTPDSPCPVCGAVEHPYAAHDPQARAMLQGLEANLTQARQAHAQLSQQLATAQAHAASSRSQLERLTQSLTGLSTDLDAANQELAALLPDLPELAGLATEAQPAWLQARLVDADAALADIDQADARQRALLAERDKAQRALEAARAAEAEARAALTQHTLAHQQAVQAQQNLAQRLEEARRTLARSLDDLDAAFPAGDDWRSRWQADPADFGLRTRAAAQEWAAAQARQQESERRLLALDAEQLAATEALNTAAGQLATRQQEFDTHAEALARMQAERADLFAGRSVQDVEAALNDAVTQAAEALRRSQEAAQAAEGQRARQDEALAQSRNQATRLQQEHQQAVQALDQWMEAFNARADGIPLDLPALRAALAHGSDWLAAERQALQALDTGVDTAAAVLRENETSLAAHQATAPGEEGVDALDARRTQLAAELAEAREAHTGIKLELARDDERRARSGSLQADLARQQARTDLWARLGELIGSADGKKFRNFAQQLTLDILLGYANRHLESLSRRYRLQRIADSLGLLVLDQDMGDELRSVHSLSGGESFLVSLALALGLASLSSHRVRVESLFIDEGFGSLDADSLRVAMEALDSLQAQGRKVGVISHVQEMTERIGTRVEVRRLAGGQSRVVVA
ncbi:AAA family ATPase [Zoogloea sp.]|uniref:AAA family ATPase n=1 Tax=Zoogloea sp. TaxID=49181 RepID=UPI0025CE84A3|nr:AAA family ATPase [Zoogloea sp.]MCK6395235.1 AAA family ATPase [Zoogloea sp.]